MTHGIVSDDPYEAGANYNVGVKVDQCWIFNTLYAYKGIVHTEGARFSRNSFVSVGWGMHVTQPDGTGFASTNDHVNSIYGAIYLENVPDFMISNLATIVQLGAVDYQDITLAGGNQRGVIANSIFVTNQGTGQADCLVVQGDNNRNFGFVNNYVANRTYGVRIKDATTASANISVLNNMFNASTVTTPILVEETDATALASYIFRNNSRATADSVALGGTATPNVGGYEEDVVFQISNNPAVTYTNFTGGYAGKTINLRWSTGDVSSIIAHGTTIKLAGSVNRTGAIGDVMRLRYNGTFWDEISRKLA